MTRATKDSGVAWIGAIPQGWGVVRFKDLMSHKKKKISPILPPGAISFGQVVQKDDDKITEETKATYQAVLEGEILINPINLNYDLKSLRTALSDINVCVSPAYIVARAKTSVSKTWLKYLLFCFDVLHMKTIGAGVRQTITFDDIGNCAAVMPPLPVQLAIADYLDRQTALIDQRLTTLAEKKTVLAELRKATIHEAVTKGLNKTAAMKDSGISWIGEIPQGWAVLRGKDIFVKRSLPAFDTDEIVTCFRDGQVTLRKNRREDGFTIALKEHGYQGVRVGDLVVHAMDAFAGAIGISESNGKCSPVYSICRARQSTTTDLRFYSYVLRDMALNGYIQSVGQGIRERSTDFRFREVEVAFYCQPTLDEQRTIADHLDRQTKQFDAQLVTLDEQAKILKELRKAIIHEAVTGKIDLSHFTPQALAA